MDRTSVRAAKIAFAIAIAVLAASPARPAGTPTEPRWAGAPAATWPVPAARGSSSLASVDQLGRRWS